MSRLRLDPHAPAFTLLLGALVTLASFATDMGLPVLDDTARSLHVPAATAALTMSVFLIGFACGPLLLGPVSARLGRRPVLILACAGFALFGALGAFAGSLPALLVWRFLMGAGAGTAQVVVLATVRDHFTGAEARAKQSYVNLAAGIAPIVAPTVGVWVAAFGGWRAIYGVLAAGGLVLLAAAALGLRESAPRTGTLTVRRTLGSYARVVRHPVTMGYVAVMALLFGCLFTYVSSSSLVMIGLLGVPQRVYGFLFASTAFGLMVGSFTNARLSRRGVPHGRLIGTGLAVIALGAVLLLALAATGTLGAWTLVPLVVLSHVGHGIVRPNAAQGALEPMPDIAGVASAVLTGVQMVVGALASGLAASLFDGRSATAMGGTMAVCALGAAAVYVLVVRPAERRFASYHVAGRPPAARPISAAA
jgi:DHA1 family bicyclomycin/chloramphenicol resistance-like MFS transporter